MSQQQGKNGLFKKNAEKNYIYLQKIDIETFPNSKEEVGDRWILGKKIWKSKL